jgi:hypothetical protein
VNDTTWSGGELLSDIAGTPSVGFAGLFAHFSHTTLEAANGDLVLAADLAAALPTGARLVFSMGCHSGLAVSDAVVGGGSSSADMAAALTAHGAAFVATTGFGYGDQVSVGLQERLMTLFAGQLDGAVSLGAALRNAKQQYFASQGLYGAYDEKALSSTIMYGMPMFAIGNQTTVRPAPANSVTAPVVGAPGLSSVPYDQAFTFAARSAAIGNWFEADTGTGPQLPQITAARPVEPRAEQDVTAAAPDSTLLPAHGAVVDLLHTGQTVADFNAAFNRPTLDNAAGEPEAVNAVAAFPTRLVGVTTASDTSGLVGPDGVAQRQHLVMIPGQYFDSGVTVGVGTQVLYDHMAGAVYYSASADWTLPQVGEVTLGRNPGDTIATISVAASDASGVHRVVALYQAGSDWQSLDLAATATGFGGSISVPATIANEQIRVVVQVVDGAGNVAWAANKGPGFAPTPPPPPPPVVTLAPQIGASGWFSSAPEVAVTAPAGATFNVSIDGGPPVPYSAPFVPTLADGAHVLDVTGSNGATTSTTIRIDTTPPDITAAVTPTPNAAGWYRTPVTATFTCGDAGSGLASCAAPVSTGANEGVALPLTGAATDRVGLSSTSTSTVDVDLTPPTTPVVTLSPPTINTGQGSAFTATSTDALSGLSQGEWWLDTDPGVGLATPLVFTGGAALAVLPATLSVGVHTVSVRTLDVAGNWSATGSSTLTVLPPPNHPPTANAQSIVTPEDQAVVATLTGTDPDAGDVLTFRVVAAPLHGTLAGTSPHLVYSPAANYNGPDSFSFVANDGTVDSAPATVSITVTPVNDPPVAQSGSFFGLEDTLLPVTVVATDVDLDPLTYAVVTPPVHGTLTGAGPNYLYTPNPNYNGLDSFTFSANDGQATSNVATVVVTLAPVNDPPVAGQFSVNALTATPTPLVLTGTDVDGDPLTFIIVTPPAHGTLSGTSPQLTYTSAAGFAGADSFVYVASDGIALSAPVTVPITVTTPATGLSISVADSANRATNLRALNGATLSGGVGVAIFVPQTPTNTVRQVTFTLDGARYSSDGTAPFDFNGTSGNRPCRTCALNAYLFESNLLSLGQHTITATVLMTNGSTQLLAATFTVAATTPHSIQVSATSKRAAPAALAGATLTGNAYIFLGAASDPIADLRTVTFRLDGTLIGSDSSVPYDAKGTRSDGTSNALNTKNLTNGTHTLTVTVSMLGGTSFVYTATFRVLN